MGVQCLERIYCFLLQGRNFLPSRREWACFVKILIPVNRSTFQKDQILGDICPWSCGFYFSSPKCPDLLWGPPSVLFSWYWGSFSWVKWPGHDVGLSPPSRTRERVSAALFLLCMCAFIMWTGVEKNNFTFTILSYVYWTVHHLDSWIKIVQLDVTCFIISLFNAKHVSNVSTSILRSLRLIVDLFHVLYCSGTMCVGVTVWFGWGGVASLCRLQPASPQLHSQTTT